jgi:hypothetical protein
MNTLLFIAVILTAAVALKAMIGFHFPWEKCPCCGHRWGDHKKTRGVVTKVEISDEDYFNTVYINTDYGSNTGLHIDKCVDFDPEVGDLVEINEIDWTIRKI